ncbi:MAG: DUF2959 domain-containing protein [Gammaproteobacteria bacterium]|nr:DUF2959 domain-containing protein [Gammaproteobacteria bacterium]
MVPMKATRLLLFFLPILISGCSTVYYDTMEQAGFHKRDILVDRVEDARDAQSEAQEQFKSALDQFASVVQLQETDLKQAYEQLNEEFEDSQAVADQVSRRINKVESVADALFEEWEEELNLYQNQQLKSTSRRQLNDTRRRYNNMLSAMRSAEKSMQPILDSFQDNVLFLKHNLNAQAIGALRGEFSSLKAEINQLITRMNRSIERSNGFIQSMQTN